MSGPNLTFVIPVRHPDNAANWSVLKSNLAETMRSIAAQTDRNWCGIVVANDGADLPTLPRGFAAVRVSLPPNRLYAIGSATLEEVWDAVRLDKGRRVLAGVLAARRTGHLMVVDDDDFVSRRLAAFVGSHPRANGWWVRDGLVWRPDGRVVYRMPDFDALCGTSHIVRTALYGTVDQLRNADDDRVRRMFGSHKSLRAILDAAGTPLAPLPFRGAVYRVGHPGAHSRSAGVIRTFFNGRLLGRPIELATRLTRLGLMDQRTRDEFLGRRPPSVPNCPF